LNISGFNSFMYFWWDRIFLAFRLFDWNFGRRLLVKENLLVWLLLTRFFFELIFFDFLYNFLIFTAGLSIDYLNNVWF
jgi:hypothetical protein